MPIPLLLPSGGKTRPAQTLLGPLQLDRGRVHEFCGAARHMLALVLLHATSGPVVWAHPGWQMERLMCDGIAPLADPGRLILAQAHRGDDVLWTIEEALRSGAVPLIVAELPVLPGLTAVRRLQLAAEAGADAARELGLLPPLGLLLTPGGGGAPGVESRWQMTPRHTPDLARWQLARLRARNAPPADWRVGQDSRGRPLLLQPDPQPADTSVLNSA